MSVILDALKKLDREKASRRHGTANIAAEILRPDLPRTPKRTPLLLAIVVFTALVTAALTYTVVKSYFASKPLSSVAANSPAKVEESSPGPRYSPPAELTRVAPSPASGKTTSSPSPKADSQTKPSPPPPVSLSVVTPSAASPPVATPPAPSQPLTPATASPGPVQATREEINPVPAKIEPPVESKPAPSSPPEKETGQNGIMGRTNMTPGNTEQPVHRSPVTPSLDPSALRVSAIVWHEEPSKRIAVINGTITTEQSLIEGAKVVEISPNRVRLSYNGRAFEILLK